MAVICFLFLLISYAIASPVKHPALRFENEEEYDQSRFLLTRNELGRLEMVDLMSQNIICQVTHDDVQFHLYTAQNVYNDEVLTITNFVNSTYFDPKKQTVFVTHGWLDDYQSKLNELIKGSMLENYDMNVIVVDWSYAAKENYFTAAWSVTTAGEAIANFITKLTEHFSMDLKQFSLVGHSLGAHVSGNAGAALDGQVAYIMGLDPAGPLFSYSNTDNRLDPTDAAYVEVIHTSLLLGFRKSIGHCDFYPNGGMWQPGCGLDLDNVCAHGRSYEYYAESLKNYKFLGHKCESYDDYQAGLCNKNKIALMGQAEIDKKVRGKYFLKTRSSEPYAFESE